MVVKPPVISTQIRRVAATGERAQATTNRDLEVKRPKGVCNEEWSGVCGVKTINDWREVWSVNCQGLK